jgi:hypothetical protein
VSATDFVVTIHALERMEERFTDTVEGLDDETQAQLIHAEVHDALEAGRHSTVPPIELSARSNERWEARTSGSYYVWTQDKTRGYLVVDDPEEGMVILTVIVGIEREKAVYDRLRKRSKATIRSHP